MKGLDDPRILRDCRILYRLYPQIRGTLSREFVTSLKQIAEISQTLSDQLKNSASLMRKTKFSQFTLEPLAVIRQDETKLCCAPFDLDVSETKGSRLLHTGLPALLSRRLKEPLKMELQILQATAPVFSQDRLTEVLDWEKRRSDSPMVLKQSAALTDKLKEVHRGRREDRL